MQMILISGLAGAGKSTALNILEDSGYTCIDNLPPTMLVQLIHIYSADKITSKIAVGIDTRSHTLLQQLHHALSELPKIDLEIKILFLDARSDILIKRFSETRRKHPLADKYKTLNDCIYEERNILSTLSSQAHRIDTSELTANHLRNIIKQFVDADYSQLNVVVQSFGFKYGLPIDADFVFDVRCLPNPHYDQTIQHFIGTQEPIIAFLSKSDKVQKMLNDIYVFMQTWLVEFSKDNRNYLTIAIGCTGGKHRSVYLSECLYKLINQLGYTTIIRHRHINIDT